jgi:PIN domain nuclease of toxin-antitoxin system
MSGSGKYGVTQRHERVGNAIKHRLGKLKLSIPLEKVIEEQRQTNSIDVLPIVLEHVLELENLPDYQRPL